MNNSWKEEFDYGIEKLTNQKRDTSGSVYRLTPSEIESFRQEMKESGEWMRKELKKRKLAREKGGEK